MFQRSEHLSRHKLNHNPRTIFTCEKCGKTFVRHDLLGRHLKRHDAREKLEAVRKHDATFHSGNNRAAQPPALIPASSQPQLPPIAQQEFIPQNYPINYLTSSNPNPDYQQQWSAYNGNPNFINWLFTENQYPVQQPTQYNDMFDLNEFRLTNDNPPFMTTDQLYPLNSQQIQDDNNNGINPTLKSFQMSQGIQTNSLLTVEENLWTLEVSQMEEFATLIPPLRSLPDFDIARFQKALKTYWNFFHVRFPMLHKPTFRSTKMDPILILAMVMMGSKLYNCVDNDFCDPHMRLIHNKLLSDTICESLRWLIFASPHFKAPAKVWIYQSLLLLEFYEKHCSTRKLHERGHIHHGTTIQLLRRSPTLGGCSPKYGNDVNTYDNWLTWVEVESLKRVTFMCFYMDATDAVNFGHQMLVYAHQMQMNMPVDDKLWNFDYNDFKLNYKNFPIPNLFLIDLKNMMNDSYNQPVTSFSKKILLAGLSSILFQIQQRDTQLIFGIERFSNSISNNWRDLLAIGFSTWRNDVAISCCSSKSDIDKLNVSSDASKFSTNDTRCKNINYHVAHVFMSVSHYDIMIVAGAPWRMSIKPSSKEERLSIEKRVSEWSKTKHADLAVVQCYLLLFEMFLSPQDSPTDYQYDYLPDADLYFRSYVIGFSLMTIWCYHYLKSGFRKINLDSLSNKCGFQYLRDVRNQFTQKSNGVQLHKWFSKTNGSQFYKDLTQWVSVCDQIEGFDNLVGLTGFIGSILSNADYSCTKELGKLLLFCQKRSIRYANGEPCNNEIYEEMYSS